MKNIFASILFVFGATFLLPLSSGTAEPAYNFSTRSKTAAAPAPLPAPSAQFPAGERLHFEITWIGVPVGVGDLRVRRKMILGGREVYHVVGIVRTTEFLYKIYPVNYVAQCWIDAKTFESVRFRKRISEGAKRQNEITYFDGAGGGRYESFRTGEKKTFRTSVPVHDAFSSFYWARRQDLGPGKSAQTVVSADQKDWGLRVDGLKRETLEPHGQGSVDAILVTPVTREAGRPEKKGRSWFHLSADPSRKPVRLTFKAPFGTVEAKLKKAPVV